MDVKTFFFYLQLPSVRNSVSANMLALWGQFELTLSQFLKRDNCVKKLMTPDVD